MSQIEAKLHVLSLWQKSVIALAIGMSSAFALPPYNAIPVLLISYTGLIFLLNGCDRKYHAAVIGWCFGYGQFVVGLYWIANALLIDPVQFAWMVPFAILGLPALLAFFSSLATLFTVCIPVGCVARPLTLAIAWTGAEWLRGHILSGFPWNLIGYTWTASDEMLQFTSIVGIHGLGFLTVLVAAAPAVLTRVEFGWRRLMPGALILVSIVAIWSGGNLRISEQAVTDFNNVRLRIVQGNIKQHHKWHDELRQLQFERYLELSSSPGSGTATHIIWPETALPFALKNKNVTSRIGNLVRLDGAVITGVIHTAATTSDPPAMRNSLQTIGHDGRLLASYHKQRLVPFGEYLPFRSLLALLGLTKVTSGAVDFTAGHGSPFVTVKGLPTFTAIICYEAIFPHHTHDSKNTSLWLLNITNDAWFGDSSGPHQHFAMARVRAIEQGKALVRAANTGISAIVDPYGRVQQRLDLGEHGVIDGNLPRPLDQRPYYARWGDITTLLFIMVTAVILLLSSGEWRKHSKPR